MKINKKKYYLQKILISVCALAVTAGAHAQNPYIDRVYEFRPAPGQFVNVLPEYEPGDNEETMRRKAEECLRNDERVLISLGSFGGYVVFGFDHMVENKPGQMDLLILGNAYYDQTTGLADEAHVIGNSEPGTVWVSYDTNGNSLPDDAWYELAGSEHHNPLTRARYSVTYQRPDEEKTPVKGRPFESDITYIPWKDSEGAEGYVVKNTYHRQSYYPLWLEDTALTFTGTLLPPNAVDASGGQGNKIQQTTFAYGYVDNHPNTSDRSLFNIDWAVDADGNPVSLPGIHFVKVQSGTLQQCGWLGESSTEVMGATDLHLLGETHADFTPVTRPKAGSPSGKEEWFSLDGMPLSQPRRAGIYLLRKGGRVKRVIWK